jgi:hypothetical protein
MLFETGDLRSKMQRYRLQSAREHLGDRAEFKIIETLDVLKADYAEAVAQVEAREDLSRIGKDAEIKELRTLYREDVKNLRARLAALAPTKPATAESALPQPTPADLALAQTFGARTPAEQTRLAVAMLAGEQRDFAEALARAPQALSNMAPSIHTQLRARLAPADAAADQARHAYATTVRLHGVVAQAVDEFEQTSLT